MSIVGWPAVSGPPGRGVITKTVRRYAAHALVTVCAGALILAPGVVAQGLNTATQSVLALFGWAVLAASSGALVVCLIAALGPLGRMRVGGPGARPEFSRFAWLMMLFAAGMGTGLVFWGVAEPLIHALAPKPGTPADADPRRASMAIVLLHWALHPWAIYGVGAIAIGHFGFERAREAGANGSSIKGTQAHLRPSTALGLSGLGARAADVLALFAVIFGIVASLGQGVIQISAGLGGGVVGGQGLGLVVLAVLFASYMASAATGLSRGIKWLSEINLALAVALLIFVFLVGPTVEAARTMLVAAGDYMARLPAMSVDVGATPVERQWARDWTLTYFLWWIAWIPFVGVFIARISYGRTIRELVTGVLLIPSLFTLAWYAVMGGAALHAQLVGGADFGVSDIVTAPLATFALLSDLPWAAVTRPLAMILVFVFLVTSADSGAFVLAMLSDEGEANPPVAERLFWGVAMAGLTAGALLTGGGQMTMRALAVAGGVPMLVMMVAMGARLLAASWSLRRSAPRPGAAPDAAARARGLAEGGRRGAESR